MNSSTLSDMTTFIGFPFRDVDWQRKLGIAALVGLTMLFIPILPLVLLAGYCMRIARSILDDDDGRLPSLPEWDEPMEMFKDGLKVSAATLTLILPMVVLALVLYAILVVPLTAASDSLQNGERVTVLLLTIFGTCISFFVILAAFALGLVMPAAITHVIAKRSYRAVFEVKEWLGIWRANLGGFLLSYLVVMVLSMGLSLALSILSVTIILLCLTPFLTGAITAYITIIQSALAAREYRIGRQRVWEKLGVLGEPLVPTPAAAKPVVAAPAPQAPGGPGEPARVVPAQPAAPASPAVPAAEATATAVYSQGAKLAQAAEPVSSETTAAGLAAAAVATMMVDRAQLKEELAEPAKEAAPVVEGLPVKPEEVVEVLPEVEADAKATAEIAKPLPPVEPLAVIEPLAAVEALPAIALEPVAEVLPVAEAAPVEALPVIEPEVVVEPLEVEIQEKKRKPRKVKTEPVEAEPLAETPPVEFVEKASAAVVEEIPLVTEEAGGTLMYTQEELSKRASEAEAQMSEQPATEEQSLPAESPETPAEADSGATVIYKREDLLGKTPPENNE